MGINDWMHTFWSYSDKEGPGIARRTLLRRLKIRPPWNRILREKEETARKWGKKMQYDELVLVIKKKRRVSLVACLNLVPIFSDPNLYVKFEKG